ncbi:MAG TPA: hypothetical protein VF921_10185 [Vicinamibacterales bacterium]
MDLDAWLLAVPRRAQYLAVLLALLVCVAVGILEVPRPYLDYSRRPILNRINQNATYGTDTIADVYESKVVLNDVRDAYTKAHLDQTPLEAATWTKAESAPYPPAVLLTMAGLYALGERTGVGFYGLILALACLFLVSSAVYCLMTRWYVFPLMCLNAGYIAERFVYVQDDSYLVLLTVVMAALFLARARTPATHLLMAVAICMKLSPLYYLKNVLTMKRWMAAAVVVIVITGLALPYFFWDHYLYIYQFHAQRKGHWQNAAGALSLVVPFSLLLWYVETRLAFDMEDRVGWSLVPFALLIAIMTNAPRHLFVVLLVPDKRAARTAAGAFGLGLHSMLPSVLRSGGTVYFMTAFLSLALVWYLRRIGWETIRVDLRHPVRTARTMLAWAP